MRGPGLSFHNYIQRTPYELIYVTHLSYVDTPAATRAATFLEESCWPTRTMYDDTMMTEAAISPLEKKACTSFEAPFQLKGARSASLARDYHSLLLSLRFALLPCASSQHIWPILDGFIFDKPPLYCMADDIHELRAGHVALHF